MPVVGGKHVRQLLPKALVFIVIVKSFTSYISRSNIATVNDSHISAALYLQWRDGNCQVSWVLIEAIHFFKYSCATSQHPVLVEILRKIL